MLEQICRPGDRGLQIQEHMLLWDAERIPFTGCSFRVSILRRIRACHKTHVPFGIVAVTFHTTWSRTLMFVGFAKVDIMVIHIAEEDDSDRLPLM